ncbi:hypothetical protein [Deinococcus sp.]|uniref:hypothetical protein n=1 Tax=Deinococcus sp. TaxID=47478 RepID=UPI003B5C42C4
MQGLAILAPAQSQVNALGADDGLAVDGGLDGLPASQAGARVILPPVTVALSAEWGANGCPGAAC